MAKVTITVEDSPDGKVRVKCDPTFETMMKMNASGNPLTSAHGYAIAALNRMREASQTQGGKIIVPVPRIGRRH